MKKQVVLFNDSGHLKKYSSIAIGIFFISTGVLHFFLDQFLISIIPPIFPLKKLIVLLSGVYEILIGSFMIFSKSKKIAAWAMVILLIAVFPVHIYMLIAANEFPQFSQIFFPLRILLQFILIYWAFLHTK